MDETADGFEEGELIEDCTTPIMDQASMIQTTRETKAICSEESSSEKSDDSDDDSDNQCSRPKRAKGRAQLPAPHRLGRNDVPSKFKVWSTAMQEDALTETLTKCDVEAIERDRDVESYNYKVVDKIYPGQFGRQDTPDTEENYIDNDVDRPNDGYRLKLGGKRRHGDIKKRLGHRKVHAVRLPLLRVTTDDSAEDVAQDIASKLQEEKVDLILNVVLVLGKERAIALYNKTKTLEENGGVQCMNGSRRRTSGGVYLFLIKGDHTIPADNMKAIFADDSAEDKRKKSQMAKKRRKKRQQAIKEMLIREKLLNLNTEGANKDVPNETESNNLEEGELEPNVSNPPPSPATDQDTPPSRTQAADGLTEDEVEPDPPMVEEEEVVDPHGRKIVSYDDADSYDYVDLEVNEMDLF